jgi:hypothetical protein
VAKKKYNQDRNKLLARVHIIAKDLGMQDYEYRAVLAELFDVDSARSLTVPQLTKLAGHLQKKLDQVNGKKGTKDFYAIPGDTPYVNQKRYLAALYHALGYKMSGLDTMVRRMFKVDKFVWLNDQDQLQLLAKTLISKCVENGIEYSPEGALDAGFEGVN